MAGRKIFVGSLPNGIMDETLRLEMGKYGTVEDIYIKQGCEPGRQWAFVTYASPEQAQFAKESCDRILHFPGAEKPCDVMMAKNQGMFGQQSADGGLGGMQMAGAGLEGSKKIFVGSLPDGIVDATLRAEFSKYGVVEEIYIKQNCEPGRQWAFVTFSSPEQAQLAQESTNGVLMFPGSVKACEVTLARNQGMFGQNPIAGGPKNMGGAAPGAPRKVFVGSLPDGIDEMTLRTQLGPYGTITEVFIKQNCEPGRQWAFVTFADPTHAQFCKDSCDRVLVFPGHDRACEVTMAKNQGMFGQDPMAGGAPQQFGGGYGQMGYGQQVPGVVEGPRKVFVGSLPESVTDVSLRAEFSKYGQITDVFLKMDCEPGRRWAFVTFGTPEQAQFAKDSTDRVLYFPGADKPCEVMLAKNQGKFGQGQGGVGGGGGGGGAQPPPPQSAPPAHLTPWRMYKTAAGLPYYHNSVTGITQWECPPELSAPAGGYGMMQQQGMAQVRYSPY